MHAEAKKRRRSKPLIKSSAAVAQVQDHMQGQDAIALGVSCSHENVSVDP